MLRRDSYSLACHAFRRICAALAVCVLFASVATAQGVATALSSPGLSMPVPMAPPSGFRRVTLSDAQQLAAAAADPLVRLGQLQVEAAKQHRLGVQSLYFPNIATQAAAIHLTEPTGEVFTVRRPFLGVTQSIAVDAFFQDQWMLNVGVTQPITQLFGVRQLVRIARADENIARAKAGMPVLAMTQRVEKAFFELLVAERELAGAGAEARKMPFGFVTVTDGGVKLSPQPADTLRAETAVGLAASKVKALTASLNDLLGLPVDTRLELVTPEPFVESLTLSDVVARAATGTEVVEAEQTAVKAHAATSLAKMQYGPSIAFVGGYLHQQVLNDALLPSNFAYLSVVGTYTLFDSLKRERAVKEASAQAEAADLGVELAKAKAAGGARTAYFELERSREAYQIARRAVVAMRILDVRYAAADDQDLDAARARAEADMFRAEIEYREAYARVRGFMGGR